MPRRQVVSKAAIARAVKGALDGGMKLGRVDIEGGRIALYSAEDFRQEPTTAFDGWKAKRDAR